MSGNEPLRPLPAQPSLEFERKRAKKFLRQRRRTNPGAQLADAQFVIAREYGFASWPRLVMYFDAARRESEAPFAAWYPVEHHEQRAESLLRGFQQRRRGVAWAFAAFVPRFYGRSITDILGEAVTMDDARHVVARSDHAPSWEALVARSRPDSPDAERSPDWDWFESPDALAWRALKAFDHGQLDALITATPALLELDRFGSKKPRSLLRESLLNEFEHRTPEWRAMSDWLVARGGNLHATLDQLLFTGFRWGPQGASGTQGVEYLRYLVERGANPQWVAPTGVNAFEHALLAYNNPAAAEYLARLVTPRRTLWIAAGLGDIAGIRACFDAARKLNDDVRRHRPAFMTTRVPLPALADADDATLMFEAMLVAMLNKRVTSAEALLDLGFPVDFDRAGAPLVNLAVMTGDLAFVDLLVARGADLDIRGELPDATARELAASSYLDRTGAETARRIRELCAVLPPDAPSRGASRTTPPRTAPRLAQLLDAAHEEAARLGQRTVEPHNLVVAFLRGSPPSVPLGVLNRAGVRMSELRGALAPRLVPPAPPASRVPLGQDAERLVARAVALAEEHERTAVNPFHLLAALLEDDAGYAATLFASHGGDIALVRAPIVRSL